MRPLALRTILVAVAPDNPSLAALESATVLANAAGAPLHIVTVIADDSDRANAGAREQLRELLAQSAHAPDEEPVIHVVLGDIVSVIGSVANRIEASAIVLGPYRRADSGTRSLGGTALAVVTNASSPCLVMSAPLRLPLTSVVVPVDLSDTARGALLTGLSWASALRARKADVGATLTAIHVQPAASAMRPAIDSEIAFVRQAAGTWAGVAIKGEAIVSDDVPRGIADYVSNHAADLMVMGTRGLGLDARGRLGSVAASVASQLETPLLLVPPAVWMSYSAAP